MEIRDNEDTAIKLLQENVELKKIIKEIRKLVEDLTTDEESIELMDISSCAKEKMLEILNKVK